VKHRHRLQQQRRRPASSSRPAEVHEETEEQPQSGSSRAKKRPMHHMKLEGGRTKLRLDKFRRGGRSAKRYDAGGGAPPGGGSPTVQDFNSIPTVNPVTRFVQQNIPPASRYLKQGFTARPPAVPTKPGVPTSVLLNSKQGGRIHNNRAKGK
jgi:hypothetical protein